MMTTARQLTIQIDPAGLAALAAADQRVTLVRPGTASRYAVVWQAIAPVGTVVVGWDGGYQVYQSTTPLRAGAPLRVGSSAAAAGGYRYPFAGGQFGAGAAGLDPAEIGIANRDQAITMAGVAMFIGGLCQTAMVGGQPVTNPLDAAPVLFGEDLIGRIDQQVLVFPAGGMPAGTVLPRSWLAGTAAVRAVSIGQPLLVDLTTQPRQSVSYDTTTNQFVPGSG